MTRLGAVVSEIVTVKVDEPVLPAPSAAVHVTVVAPTGKPYPDVGRHVTAGEPATASVAVGSVQVTIVFGPSASTKSMFDIGPTTGAMVSLTTMLKDPVRVLLA